MNLIKMKCENCGATLDVNKDLDKIHCNYCGAEILIDDEATAVKRVEEAKLKARKDNHEQNLKERQENLEQDLKEKEILDNTKEAFKKSKFSKVLLVFFGISVLFFFIVTGFLAKLLTLVQVGLFITAWLMGMKIVKEPMKGLKTILAIVAFVLIVPIVSTGGSTGGDYEKLVWDDIVLNDILPEPDLKKVDIHDNDKDGLWMSIGKADKSDYRKYMEECEKFGYTIDAEKDNNSYKAYDKNGNKIELRFSEHDSEIDVNLDIAMKMEKDVWPTSNIAELLPKPKSEKGHLEWEYETEFLYYAADTSEEDYNQYVNDLKERGFDVDFNKGDDYYYAYNKSGYYVTVNLEGFNIMQIRISSPKDNEEEKETKEETKNETKEESKKETKYNGLRTDFKKAMDDYESFMNEYVSFMKKYMADPSNSSLLKDYANYMSEYSKMVNSFDKWESEDMNDAETAYYLEVQSRVIKKLSEIQ